MQRVSSYVICINILYHKCVGVRIFITLRYVFACFAYVHRLVSEMTVEENILKKANQKRLLGDLAIEGGNFTTAYFKSVSAGFYFQVTSID